MVRILATETDFPDHYYRQEEIFSSLSEVWSPKGVNLHRVEQFHKNVKVDGRHLALPIESYYNLEKFGDRNDAWVRVALDLGEKVLTNLLDKAGLLPMDIACLAFTTVTGIAVPSIEARLMNRIPFSRQLKRIPLFGLGCLGGAAGVARVADYLQGHPEEAAILLSIELCSLTIQRSDLSVANIISSGLFGDGASAVLMVGERHPLAQKASPGVLDTQSCFFPDSEDVMGWKVNESGFKILLSANIADIAERQLRPLLCGLLEKYGLGLRDIDYWITHPGGPKVLEAITRGLDLEEDALSISWESLAKVGNISSTSVLIVLDETLKRFDPDPGSYGVMMAMGPAFAAEFVLLQW